MFGCFAVLWLLFGDGRILEFGLCFCSFGFGSFASGKFGGCLLWICGFVIWSIFWLFCVDLVWVFVVGELVV